LHHCGSTAKALVAHERARLRPSETGKTDTSKKTDIERSTHESLGGLRLVVPYANVFWPVDSTGKICALRFDERRALAVRREIARAIFGSLEYFRSNVAPHFCQYYPREIDTKKPRGRDKPPGSSSTDGKIGPSPCKYATTHRARRRHRRPLWRSKRPGDGRCSFQQDRRVEPRYRPNDVILPSE